LSFTDTVILGQDATKHIANRPRDQRHHITAVRPKY